MTSTPVFDEILEFVTGSDPNKILGFHLSDQSQKRVESLIEKEKESSLNEEEKHELDYFLMFEHLMRIAKARALKQLPTSK